MHFKSVYTNATHVVVFVRRLLLSPDNLELPRNMHKVVRVCLRNELPLVRLLHKVLISLLVRKVDGIFLRLELHLEALHKVGG
jgi:hypothetical protein